MARIAIVGGGLAGMACAAALAGRGLQIELFEGRRKLGGRAGSYVDRATGEAIDHCQHVGMGCCTNYLDFCLRTGIREFFTQQNILHFIGPDGRRSDFAPSRWLPAPLHLAGPLFSLRFLLLADKLSIARCVLALIGTATTDSTGSPTVLAWLKERGQSQRAIERFWNVILVSELAESLDRASLAAARKVFVDGFLAHRDAAHVLVPMVSLDELYHERVRRWLIAQGIAVHLETPVATILADENLARGLQISNGQTHDFDWIVLAVPWTRIAKLIAEPILQRIDPRDDFARIQGTPISSLHLWFDRPIMDLPNAILVGRLSQWIFARALQQSNDDFYYQVVISASHELVGRDKDSVIDEVCADLAAVFPNGSRAQLVRSKLITEEQAVFSVQPGLDAIRPRQQTAVPNLLLAGDWTHTGWPATMEGAVRSGYLAAESVLKQLGTATSVIVPDLSRNWITRWL